MTQPSPQPPKSKADRWFKLSLLEQMAHAGSEVFRAIKWQNKGSQADADLAFRRAIELLELTLADPKNRLRGKEVARVKEAFADYYLNLGSFNTTGAEWQKYFWQFNMAARLGA